MRFSAHITTQTGWIPRNARLAQAVRETGVGVYDRPKVALGGVDGVPTPDIPTAYRASFGEDGVVILGHQVVDAG